MAICFPKNGDMATKNPIKRKFNKVARKNFAP